MDSIDICTPLADSPVKDAEAYHWKDLAEDWVVELMEFWGFWEVWVDAKVVVLWLWYVDDHTSRTHPLQGVQVLR